MPSTPDLAGARQGDLVLCRRGETTLLLPFLGRRGGLLYAGHGRGITWTFDAVSGVEVGSTPMLGGGWRAVSHIGPAIDPCLAALLWDGVLARIERED